MCLRQVRHSVMKFGRLQTAAMAEGLVRFAREIQPLLVIHGLPGD